MFSLAMGVHFCSAPMASALSPLGERRAFFEPCCLAGSTENLCWQSRSKLSTRFSSAFDELSVHAQKCNGTRKLRGQRKNPWKRASFGAGASRKRVVAQGSEENGSSDKQEDAKARLRALDEQLRFFADQNGSSRRVTAVEEPASSDEEIPREFQFRSREFQELDNGFILFAGVALLLLTLVNNILFQGLVKLFGNSEKKPVQEQQTELPSQLQSSSNISLIAPPLS